MCSTGLTFGLPDRRSVKDRNSLQQVDGIRKTGVRLHPRPEDAGFYAQTDKGLRCATTSETLLSSRLRLLKVNITKSNAPSIIMLIMNIIMHLPITLPRNLPRLKRLKMYAGYAWLSYKLAAWQTVQ